MLGNLDLFKSGKKKQNKTSKNQTEETTPFVSDIDGIDIASYSKTHGISINEIKEKIKNQELVSRSERGEIYIYEDSYDSEEDLGEREEVEEEFTIEMRDTEVKLLDDFFGDIRVDKIPEGNNLYQQENKDIKEIDSNNTTKDDTDSINQNTDTNLSSGSKFNLDEKRSSDIKQNLDNLFSKTTDKGVESEETITTPPTTQLDLPPVSSIEPDSTMGYLAILAENLKISKQEQIELLKLTQESIKRVVDSTEKLVATKDTVIEEKNKIIESMQQKIDEYHLTRTKLLQENEDLKILVEVLEDSNKKQRNVK